MPYESIISANYQKARLFVGEKSPDSNNILSLFQPPHSSQFGWCGDHIQWLRKLHGATKGLRDRRPGQKCDVQEWGSLSVQ